MISVIVPAHNEANVIARGLDAMTSAARPDELEIIVVCNGCTDDTAAVARRFGAPVRVFEIDQPSKTAALNRGDDEARGFPRFYVDADVVISLDSIRRIARVLDEGPVLMATPRASVDFSAASWAVRAFYRVWMELPYNNRGGMVGTGVYAVSEKGRTRWGRFPHIISDDGFVRLCFMPDERTAVSGSISRVVPPSTLASLIRVKARGRTGLYQLRRSSCAPSFATNPMRSLLLFATRYPHHCLSLGVYVLVNILARFRARILRPFSTAPWERDDLSRLPKTPSSARQ